MAFTARIQGIKLINVGRKLGDVGFWDKDPVHPLEAGYGMIADLALQGIADMNTNITGSGRAGEVKKRPQEQEASPGPSKRPH